MSDDRMTEREYRCPGCGDLLNERMEHTTHGGGNCLSDGEKIVATMDYAASVIRRQARDRKRLRHLLTLARAFVPSTSGGLGKEIDAALRGEESQ